MKRVAVLVVLAAVLIVGFRMTVTAAVFVGRCVRGTVSLDQIDHAVWNDLLKKYVDEDGMVDYQSWHATPADRRALTEYLKHLSTARSGSGGTGDAKLAFWINAYNATTIHGILREYPTSSIRNHTARMVGYNIWTDLHLYVDARPYSLEQIEREILRRMNEPRIHFAIVCASIGCPRLLNEAYTVDRVQEQLESNSRDFFERRQNFQFDSRRGEMRLSAILKWYASDFGSDRLARLKGIAQWLPTDDARQTVESGRVTVVRHLDYNWNLNEQRLRQAQQ